jgi:hypothetical protein
MNPRRCHLSLAALAVAATLAGCSQQGGSSALAPAQNQAPAPDAAAADLDTYRQLVRIHNDQMASEIGQGIVGKYPNSAAAKEVQQTLPEIARRYKENSEKYRLASLWQYQVAPMQGGTQSTATIYSSQPSGESQVRLVLRRHTAWGQNAFLYGGGHGFVCRGNCTLATTVDDRHVGIKAFAPTTGEPALMIRDDKAFIAMLAKAKKIAIEVTTVDGGKKEALVYEVGGFDPARWAPLEPGKGKKK